MNKKRKCASRSEWGTEPWSSRVSANIHYAKLSISILGTAHVVYFDLYLGDGHSKGWPKDAKK